MRRLVVAAVALVTAWWVVLLVPGARAEAPEATGWWAASRVTPVSQPISSPNDLVPDAVPSQSGFGGTPLPQLPTVTSLPSSTPPVQGYAPVPEGGLYVAGAHFRLDGSQVPLDAVVPDRTPTDSRIPFPTPSRETPEEVPQKVDDRETPWQPAGISALRLYVGDDAAVGDLVLEFDKVQGSQVDNAQGIVAVQACVPAIVWTPEEGGPIGSAPPADCASGLSYGAVEGSTVRLPVGGLVRDGMLDVVLMPQPGSQFHAVFKKPGAKSIGVTHYPRSDDTGEFDDLPFFPDVTCDCPLGEVPVFSGTGLVDGFLVTTTDPSLFTPRPPVSGRSRVLPGGDGTLIADSVPELSTWQKALAGGVLAALAALYLVLLRTPNAGPLAIGPWAAKRKEVEDPADVPRGIGRFARVRTGPNPRL